MTEQIELPARDDEKAGRSLEERRAMRGWADRIFQVKRVINPTLHVQISVGYAICEEKYPGWGSCCENFNLYYH
ncbi:hypothetical protein ACQ3G6_18100 [Allorhizobium undicola]|uniref:hypothetical protein n=1 Tax=Allorhizobium undicola TaxID=78527 RepID=UPI003D343A37